MIGIMLLDLQHMVTRRKIEQDQKGGCYADGGNTRIWWDETADQEQKETDAEKLRKFVKSLEPEQFYATTLPEILEKSS